MKLIERLHFQERCVEENLPHEMEVDLVNSIFVDGITTSTEVSRYSGRGIGMGAVKQACENLGGEVKVQAESGKGTRFTFVFPLAVAVADPIKTKRAA